jgi:hypothetical protein
MSELYVEVSQCRVPTPRWLWSWLNVTKFMDAMLICCSGLFTQGSLSRYRRSVRSLDPGQSRDRTLWAATGMSDGGVKEEKSRRRHVYVPQSPAALKAVVRRVVHDQRARVQTGIRPKPKPHHLLATVAEWLAAKNCGGSQHPYSSNNDHKTNREVCEDRKRSWRSSAVEGREARRRHHSCEIPY